MQSTLNVWLWLSPYIALILFMVYAMMEFTVSLLVERPSHQRKPIPVAKLRERLLAIEVGSPAPEVVENSATEVEFRWQTVRETVARFAGGGESSRQRIYLLLDEERHEVRVCESGSSSFYFIGLNRWLPRIHAFAAYSAGPPGVSTFVRQLMAITHANGWTFRPVILPFQATEQGARFTRRLLPAPLRNLSPRLFWGIVYPLSYCLAFAWFFAWGGAELLTPRNLLLLLLISVAWWSLWGFITWLLCGTPRFWQRGK